MPKGGNAGKAKRLGRLQAAATVEGDTVVLTALPEGVVSVVEATEVVNADGTVTLFVPNTTGDGVALKLKGEAEVVQRFGKALVSGSRRAAGDGDDDGAEGGDGGEG